MFLGKEKEGTEMFDVGGQRYYSDGSSGPAILGGQAPTAPETGAYVEVKAAGVAVHEIMSDAIRDSAAYLGIAGAVVLKWFAPADCPTGWRVKNGETFTDSSRPRGLVRCDDPRTVWLRRGLDGKHLLRTALHESEHVRQHIKGECGVLSDAELERKADQFADQFVPEYRADRRAA